MIDQSEHSCFLAVKVSSAPLKSMLSSITLCKMVLHRVLEATFGLFSRSWIQTAS